jgi:hypothetical protein
VFGHWSQNSPLRAETLRGMTLPTLLRSWRGARIVARAAERGKCAVADTRCALWRSLEFGVASAEEGEGALVNEGKSRGQQRSRMTRSSGWASGSRGREPSASGEMAKLFCRCDWCFRGDEWTRCDRGWVMQPTQDGRASVLMCR